MYSSDAIVKFISDRKLVLQDSNELAGLNISKNIEVQPDTMSTAYE